MSLELGEVGNYVLDDTVGDNDARYPMFRCRTRFQSEAAARISALLRLRRSFIVDLHTPLLCQFNLQTPSRHAPVLSWATN